MDRASPCSSTRPRAAARAARALPRVERAPARARRRLPHRRHARPRPCARACAATPPRAGDVAVTLSGDGLSAASSASLRECPGAVARDPARRARQRRRTRARHPLATSTRRARSSPRGVERDLDIGDVGGTLVHRHRLARLRLRRQPDRERRALAARPARLRLRRPARARGLAARPLHAAARRRAASSSRATRSPPCNSRYYGGGMRLAPARSSTTACSTSC